MDDDVAQLCGIGVGGFREFGKRVRVRVESFQGDMKGSRAQGLPFGRMPRTQPELGRVIH